MRPGTYGIGLGACLTVGVADLGVLNFWIMPKVLLAPAALEAPRADQEARRAESPPAPAVPPRPAQAEEPLVADAPSPSIAPAGRLLTILFDLGRSEIHARDDKSLAELGRGLAKHGDWFVTVEGHADASGTPSFNRVLSEQRAVVVAQRLEQAGVPRARLSVRWHGSERPAELGTSRVAFQRNRRAEIVLEGAR